jgi:HTH-type transcriptional regulator/antitoxin HigA
MQNLDVSKTVNAWSSLADTVFVPHTEAEYDRLVSLLDRLVDELAKTNPTPSLRLWKLSACSSKSTKTSTFRSCLQNSWAARQLRRFNRVEKTLQQSKLSARKSSLPP